MFLPFSYRESFNTFPAIKLEVGLDFYSVVSSDGEGCPVLGRNTAGGRRSIARGRGERKKSGGNRESKIGTGPVWKNWFIGILF